MEPASFAAPIGAVVNALWVPVCNQIGYAYNMRENVQKLRNAMENLSAKREDLKDRVKREEEGQCARRTHEVAHWLAKVQEFEDRVDDVLQEYTVQDQIKCLCCCHAWNCCYTYKMGKRVYQMLDYVKELQPGEGQFEVVTINLPRAQPIEMPSETTVGLNAILSDVWKCLVQEKDVGVIGLFGMGGAGKTTLMKRINNELSHRNHDFESIIWIVVSKQVNMERIQDSMRKSLSINDQDWEGSSQCEKAAKLHIILLKKKFVLLLDDVWSWLDFLEVGVPLPNPQNKSKVIFTTRLEQVCDQMAAHRKLKVRCLTLEQAWELFEVKVGRETLSSHPEIARFAKDIVKECQGLPLALVTIGRAMAGRKNPRDWEHSLEILRSNPSKFTDMVDRVFILLEFSYDSLKDPTFQHCFRYCCIFPEDYNMHKDYLISLWIGEGLLGETDDVHKARNEGEYIIESLKLVCLLEDVVDVRLGKEYVKMHDVIRDMVTWIAHDKGKRNDRILVVEDQRELHSHMFSRWKKAERIGVFGSHVRSIGYAPPVTLELKTLIVKETEVKCLPRGFFSSMKALTVLDLSYNKFIEELSEEIGELTNLQHLDLSSTYIKRLPHELKKLIRLRCLILDEMLVLAKISTEFISSLSTLNLFSMWTSSFNAFNVCEIERGLLETLGSAEQLSDVSIRVSTLDCILTLLNHPGLRRCVRRALIHNCCNWRNVKIKLSSSNGRFLHLEKLAIFSCNGLEIMCETQELPDYLMFTSLRHVNIRYCNDFTDLSWLMHAPNLQTLTVRECRGIDKIVSGKTEEASSLFSSLISLELVDLPNLTGICDQALPFPSLQSICVSECQKLRKLPLDSNSAKNTLHEIQASLDWWNKLE